MKALLKWVVALLALVGVCALPAYAQGPRPGGAWEYVIIEEGAGGQTGFQQLNARGAAGWDLVSVSCRNGNYCLYYMKRPR